MQPLTRSQASLLAKALASEIQTRKAQNRLIDYRPYAKQVEFHAAGKSNRERLLMAANQVGKTLAAGAEVAMHLTGRYPSWWAGYVALKPEPWWASGVTSESTRDNPQRILLGRIGCIGTGMIPKDAIVDVNPRRGVPDAMDTVIVKHGGGGDVQSSECQLGFKSYDQGREKWQGETLGGVWYDEEPPEDIYTEGLTRTNVGLRPTMITFTPLQGMSAVVRRFLLDKFAGTHVTTMTIEDAEHYTSEQRASIIATYPEHERDARTKGVPQFGSGRVFSGVTREQVKVDAFPIPKHWSQICGIDFGWSHPSAAVRLAWDRDSDIVYVIAAHRQRQQTPLMFSATVKPWGDWLPWSWPHDGRQSGGKFDAKEQKQLQEIYKGHGLKMLHQHAQFEDGTNGVESGVQDMLDRMMSGRWKVFSHLAEWFEEFDIYHRKDGLIVKLNDDLISASRYAYMMRRMGAKENAAKPSLKYESVPC